MTLGGLGLLRLLWSRQSLQVVVQDVDIGNRVGASGVFDD